MRLRFAFPQSGLPSIREVISFMVSLYVEVRSSLRRPICELFEFSMYPNAQSEKGRSSYSSLSALTFLATLTCGLGPLARRTLPNFVRVLSKGSSTLYTADG